MRKYMKKKRVLAAALAGMMILLVALSVCMIMIEATHDCEGAECHICDALATLSGMLRGSVAGAAILYLSAAVIFRLRQRVKPSDMAVAYATPVTDKVCLLN